MNERKRETAVVSRDGDFFIVEPTWLSGSPLIARAKTRREALEEFQKMYGDIDYRVVDRQPEEPRDAVHHPEHYTRGDIECIDAIRAALTTEAFDGFLAGQVLKYVWRYKYKGGKQDLEKAQWYLEYLQQMQPPE